MKQTNQPCPNCGRTDGWHKAEGHPPPPVGDCRKIVWMRDSSEMEWWGVRAYGGCERGWNVNGREESSVVLFWRDGPHNPFYPPALLETKPADIPKECPNCRRAIRPDGQRLCICQPADTGSGEEKV